MSATKNIVCLDIHGNQHPVATEKLRIRPAVYGIIIQDDKILLSKQWDGYDLPGGGIDLGERTDEALKREIKEETGLVAEVGDLVCCKDSFFKSEQGNYYHSILLYYICTVAGGELSTEFFDSHEKEYAALAQWIDISQIDQLKYISTVDTLAVIYKAMNAQN